MNTPKPPQKADADGMDELEICISCLQTNRPETHFCKHCGTPLTSYAATAPFESIFAQGDFLRKAARGPRWGRWVRAFILLLIVLSLSSVLLGLTLAW